MAVQKIKKKVDTNNGFGSLPHFIFSQQAKQVLGNLFAHYPPGDGNMWEMIGENSDTPEKIKQRKDDIFARPSMTKAEIAKKLEALASRMMTSSNLKQVHFYYSPLNVNGHAYDFCWLECFTVITLL